MYQRNKVNIGRTPIDSERAKRIVAALAEGLPNPNRTAVATQFGISQSLVNKIWLGQMWRDLPRPWDRKPQSVDSKGEGDLPMWYTKFRPQTD